MPLPVLQKVLGHSSIRTTALYWKNSEDPKEKVISDKWLSGKVPKEPSKPIKNKARELPKLPENNWKIFLNIQQKTNIFISEPSKNLVLDKEKKLLEVAFGEEREQNKLLREKVKQLEQDKQEQEQIITNLKNDKQRLEKQLIQVQKDKESLLKLLSTDLKQQQTLKQLDNNKQELPQQLIAQIEIKLK